MVTTLRQLRSLRRNPERRPSGGRAWGLHVGLPLVANLLMAINLIPMRGKRRGYLMLYKPDSSWIVLICGSLAAVWGVVRTGLVVQALRKGRRPTVMPSGTRRHG
jgi:hypothetical protein